MSKGEAPERVENMAKELFLDTSYGDDLELCTLNWERRRGQHPISEIGRKPGAYDAGL